MKWLTAILAIVLIILGVSFVSYKSKTENQLAAMRKELNDKKQLLGEVPPQVAEVKAEIRKNFGGLEDKVSTLMKDKAASEEKLAALSEDMKAVLDDLQSEKANRRKVEQKNLELASSLEDVNGELIVLRKDNMQLQQDFGELQSTHDKMMEQNAAMRENYVALTKEKDQFEAMLHDLNLLRAQIRTVKIELHKEHVEDWKRRDRAEAASGNAGFLLKGGEWQMSPTEAGTSKFPINEEIRREQ